MEASYSMKRLTWHTKSLQKCRAWIASQEVNRKNEGISYILLQGFSMVSEAVAWA